MIRTYFVIVTIVGASLTTIAGCSSNGILGVDRCATVPAGAIPEPVGNKLCNWEIAQAASAYADQLVFYKSDFVGLTAELSPAATDRIGGLSQFSAADTSSLPWVVEPSGDPNLDQIRLNNVSFQLQSLGFTAANVTLASPAAIGLSGPQAERIAGSIGATQTAGGGAGNGRAVTGGSF